MSQTDLVARIAALPRPAFVVLKDPRNERALLNQVGQAIDTASAEGATMLIFPELAFSPAMLAAAQARLAAHGARGHPILTVAGLCHAPHGSDGSHLNEAVVLGPDGQELHRHRKLSRYTDEHGTVEHITTGSTLTNGARNTVRPSGNAHLPRRVRRSEQGPLARVPCDRAAGALAQQEGECPPGPAPSPRIVGAAPSCAIAPSGASISMRPVSTGRRCGTPRTNTMVRRRSYGSVWARSPAAISTIIQVSSPYRLSND